MSASLVDRISFQRDGDLPLDQVIDLYIASTLGERRPVQDRPRMEEMLTHANLIISAWDGDALVGLARSLTDFSYVAYLSDLAVSKAYQRKGIGRELVRLTRSALHPEASLVLLAAPAAVDYYPRLGFERHPAAYVLPCSKPFC